jgi:hypothetical protein
MTQRAKSDGADLPAFVRAPLRESEASHIAPRSTGPTPCHTESIGTSGRGGPDDVDLRAFDLSIHRDREALTKFLCWAVVNGFSVTVRPAHKS